jgi:hypothetical protein
MDFLTNMDFLFLNWQDVLLFSREWERERDTGCILPYNSGPRGVYCHINSAKPRSWQRPLLIDGEPPDSFWLSGRANPTKKLQVDWFLWICLSIFCTHPSWYLAELGSKETLGNQRPTNFLKKNYFLLYLY